MKLSLCLAVRNEEKNLHYPLDSAADIADEIIIVDGDSTDRTVEVAKSYGKKVRIINAENVKMFHENKQKAIEAAKGEWILQLDADEEVTPELKKEILTIINGSRLRSNDNSSSSDPELVEGESRSPVAYWIPRKNWFLNRFLMKGGQYPDYTIRLYRNRYARFPCKDVHENVEIINSKSETRNTKQIKNSNFENSDQSRISDFDIHASVGYLKSPLAHYADPDFSRYLLRWDRYTTLEVEKMMKDSKGTAKLNFFRYMVWNPKMTFLMMYFRHKGFMDGFPGFVFALFSAIRFWVIYIKWWAKVNEK